MLAQVGRTAGSTNEAVPALTVPIRSSELLDAHGGGSGVIGGGVGVIGNAFRETSCAGITH